MPGAGNDHWPRRELRRRFGLALGVSLAVHGLVAGDWPALGGRDRATVMPQLQARIASRFETAEASPAATEQAPVAVRVSHPQPSSDPVMAVVAARGAPPDSGAGVHSPDASQQYYGVHELDRFPVPVIPLNLADAPPAGTSGSVRLWLRIDHVGRVVDLAVMDGQPSATFDAAIRDRLLRASFVPASKDGRPVKSRILVELNQ